MTLSFTEKVELIQNLLSEMSEEDRVDCLFEVGKRFCRYCGGDNPSCYCWNDD